MFEYFLSSTLSNLGAQRGEGEHLGQQGLSLGGRTPTFREKGHQSFVLSLCFSEAADSIACTWGLLPALPKVASAF
jgi:hypothetical protein